MAPGQLPPTWRIQLLRLGKNHSEALELAALLRENAPHILVEGFAEQAAPPHSMTRCLSAGLPDEHVLVAWGGRAFASPRERLQAAVAISIEPHQVPWCRLVDVVPSEALSDHSDDLVEVNTGGAVYFLFFSLLGGSTSEAGGARRGRGLLAGEAEGLAVLKLGTSRLLMQSELFAGELIRYLDIATPACRIIRQDDAAAQPNCTEWEEAAEALSLLADGGCGPAADLMAGCGRLGCCLLMEFVAGGQLAQAREAFQPPRLLPTLRDLGRLFLADMLLGNADRLPCAELGWRGNAHNLLYGARGSRYSDRPVAIDSCVARRPPASKASAEDVAVERVAQLALASGGVAAHVLAQLLAGGQGAQVAGLSWAAASEDEGCPVGQAAGVASFQAGLRETLVALMAIKGLLEMVLQVTSGWVADFMADILALHPELTPDPAAAAQTGGRRPSSAQRVSPIPRRASSPHNGNGSRPPSATGYRSSSFTAGTTGASAGGAAGAVGGNSSRRACSLQLESGDDDSGWASPSASPCNSPPVAKRVMAQAGRPPLSPGPSARPHGGHQRPGAAPGDTATAAGSIDCNSLDNCLSDALDSQQEPGSPPRPGGGLLPLGASRRVSVPALSMSPPAAAHPLVSPRRASDTGPSRPWLAPQALRSPRADIEEAHASAAAAASQVAAALASITAGARKDEALADRVEQWKEHLRLKSAELRQAIGEWQARHPLGPPGRALTTGFLDGQHPLVDAYELAVRLDHLLRRLAALQAAAGSCMPWQVLPGLWLGGAVAADSHHILRHLGITHIVNATHELLEPAPEEGFTLLRVPLSDVDQEDAGLHFRRVSEWITSARAASAGVLVHCYEGKSRSVTLLLAHLMISQGCSLREALQRVRAVQPHAAPNAGFMNQLAAFEKQLRGSCSVSDVHMRRGKPQAQLCPVCRQEVGVSSASLALHMKAKHGDAQQQQGLVQQAGQRHA